MNKHGLSRTIPEEVKRQIRINSGFGCVICGMGIIEYEHVEPEYNEAKTHDPSKMTLLCAGCHGNVTRGLWSKEKVKRAMANPKALSQGFSNGFYDIGYEHPQVHFAGSKFVNSQIPIMIGGIPIIQINPPTEENGYFLLSAIFNDGMNILKIIDNEWMSPSLNWDLTVVGRKLTIRESQRNIVLELTAYPPNAIEVSNLEMHMPGHPYKLKGNANDFSIIYPSGEASIIKNCTFENNRVDIRIG